MKAILLAAGRGTRISKSINMPKSTLPVNDETIIEHSVRLFTENNIKVVVVTGFMSENIHDALKKYDVTYYHNPFFAVTNSAGSLWVAKEELDDDIIIGNADVYWEQPLLDLLLNAKNDISMLADKSRVNVGDYFFKCDGDILKDHGKQLKLNERDSEYVGLARIKKDAVASFKGQIERLIADEHYDRWWENALYDYRDESPIHVIDVGDLFWSEVDYISDYECILNYLKNRDPSVKLKSILDEKIGRK